MAAQKSTTTDPVKQVNRNNSENNGGLSVRAFELKGMIIDTTIINDLMLEGRRTRPAIFTLEHLPSGRRLIIGTGNLSKRMCDQARYLARRHHHNPALQADLLRDGPEAFQMVLLELPDDPHELRRLRRLWVEETRRLGLTYHAAEPESRRRLIMPTIEYATPASAADATAPDRGTTPTLADSLQRLRAWIERNNGHGPTSTAPHPSSI
ncbi:MAG: hypothetical protein WCI73_00455 [Phycisphaerae bacterium]